MKKLLRAFISFQTSFELPQAANFDPYTPRIKLDSANVKQSKDFPAALKKYLMESFKLPLEERLQRLKRDDHQGNAQHCHANNPRDLRANGV